MTEQHFVQIRFNHDVKFTYVGLPEVVSNSWIEALVLRTAWHRLGKWTPDKYEYKYNGIYHTPYQRTNLAQVRFLGGSGRRAEAYTRPAWPKISSVPSAFPLLGGPQAPGNEPSPKGSKSLGGRPPEAGGNLLGWGTPVRIRSVANTADRMWPDDWGEETIISTTAVPRLITANLCYIGVLMGHICMHIHKLAVLLHRNVLE